MFAVEKNVNAVVTLQHLKLEHWGDQVGFKRRGEVSII